MLLYGMAIIITLVCISLFYTLIQQWIFSRRSKWFMVGLTAADITMVLLWWQFCLTEFLHVHHSVFDVIMCTVCTMIVAVVAYCIKRTAKFVVSIV